MVNVSLHTSNVYKTNNNISDLNEVNNTNIKEWRISLQWLVDVAKLDLTTPGQIEPMQGQIEPNIGKFRKTHNTISLRQGTFGAHLWLAIILSAILDVSHYKDHKIAIKTLQLKIRTWNKNEHPQVWVKLYLYLYLYLLAILDGIHYQKSKNWLPWLYYKRNMKKNHNAKLN